MQHPSRHRHPAPPTVLASAHGESKDAPLGMLIIRTGGAWLSPHTRRIVSQQRPRRVSRPGLMERLALVVSSVMILVGGFAAREVVL